MAMASLWGGGQEENGNFARCALLIGGVERLQLFKGGPESCSLLWRGHARRDRDALAADLRDSVWLREQVEIPGRMIIAATVRRDENEVDAVAQVVEGPGTRLPCLAPGGGEQQHRHLSARRGEEPPAGDTIDEAMHGEGQFGAARRDEVAQTVVGPHRRSLQSARRFSASSDLAPSRRDSCRWR